MKATRAGNALDPGDPGPNFPFIKAYPLHLKWFKSTVFQTGYSFKKKKAGLIIFN